MTKHLLVLLTSSGRRSDCRRHAITCHSYPTGKQQTAAGIDDNDNNRSFTAQ